MARAEGAVFLLVAGALLLVGSLGFFLNDEAELGAAAHNLYRGNLTVDDVPLDYYRGPLGLGEPRVQRFDGHGYISETRASAFLAAPVFLVLLAWSALLPVQALLALAATGALAGGVALLRRDAWRALPARRARIERVALACGALVFLAVNLVGLRHVPAIWLAPLALQLTSVLIVATGVVALRALATRLAGDARVGDITALLLSLTTGVFFWGFGQKYHATQVAALCIALWLRYSPGHTLRHHALAALVAGLAFWSHARTGALLVGSLGLIELVLLARGAREWRPTLRRALVLSTALAVGLAPYALENTLLYGNPLFPGYALHVTGSGIATPEVSDAAAGAIASNPFRDPSSALKGLFAAIIDPGPVTTTAVQVNFGLLMLAPLLALAPLGVGSWRRWGTLDAFALVYVCATLFMYGARAAAPGGGTFDSRFLVGLQPILALYAARALATRTDGRAWRRGLALAGAMLVGVLLALAASGVDGTTQFLALRQVARLALAATVLWAIARTIAGDGPRARLADPAILALAILPALWFASQHVLHEPPRSAFDADGERIVAHFLPLTEALARGIARLLVR